MIGVVSPKTKGTKRTHRTARTTRTQRREPRAQSFLSLQSLQSCGYLAHSILSSRRSAGIFQAVTPTTPSVINPPKITEGTVPSSFAATPDSKEPISLEELLKLWFTAETRPNRCSGVRRVSSVERITTLTLSTMPLTASSASDSQNDRERAKKTQQSPKAATQRKRLRPARRRFRWARTTDITTAPAAGA